MPEILACDDRYAMCGRRFVLCSLVRVLYTPRVRVAAVPERGVCGRCAIQRSSYIPCYPILSGAEL